MPETKPQQVYQIVARDYQEKITFLSNVAFVNENSARNICEFFNKADIHKPYKVEPVKLDYQ